MRLVLLALLTAGTVWQLVTHLDGDRRLPLVAALAVPALLVGGLEARDWQVQADATAAVLPIAKRPVQVQCQRLTGAWVDPTAEAGYVRFSADGQAGRTARLEWDACRGLRAWLGDGRRGDAPLPQVVAVHVLAHEAVHLTGVTDEAVTECRSLPLTATVARLLGASPDQAVLLAERYVREVYPRMPSPYVDQGCRTPRFASTDQPAG